ncbi:hypothetical protein [Isoptericola halotolerans]|uniref:Uncharacterized protein n=1 Tax=Isoptericola halotolerans TaxID=300560 RepID=A0ABX2A3X1_9MICO|nr:hypothetical protein [Isoptericola halotolerans]NOV97386.1 hypothetical protein [Isoptericola halotolerans]
METSPAGLAALALFVLWLGYWVPQRVRHRQQLADAQLDDRFSGGLRVLAVADGGSDRARAGGRRKEGAMRQSDRASAVTGSVPPTGARAAGPPSGATPRVRTQRLAVLERRAARARRRFLVTLGLVLVTAGAWAAVGLGYLVWWGAMVPTALLAAVLLLGRFAVLAARRSDARWRAERRAEQQRATQERTLAHGGPYAPRNRARITGRAVHPSDTSTGMIPRVRPATAGQAEPAERGATHREAETSVPAGDTRTGDADDTEPVREAPGDPRPSTEPWEPVPVPLPTYVTKPAAPRREQATTVPTHETRAAPPGAVPTAEAPSTGERPGPDERHEGGRELEEPRPRTETLGLPLEQILARRRAAG